MVSSPGYGKPECSQRFYGLIAIVNSRMLRSEFNLTAITHCRQVSLIQYPMYFSCIKLVWVWMILCTLAATNASLVLGLRLWALYERDRRVLAALIIGFLCCFSPAWTLTFRAGSGPIDPLEQRMIHNVYAYVGGIAMRDGMGAVNWPLRKCYHFPFPRVATSIVIAAFLYESK